MCLNVSQDYRFLSECILIANKSSCFSRHVGAVIVQDDKIIASGYNDPPLKSLHCSNRVLLTEKDVDYTQPCLRRRMGFKSGEGLVYCPAVHAERAALLDALNHNVYVRDAIMYMNCGIPCSACLLEIIYAKIQGIVCASDVLYDDSAEWILNHSQLKWRLYFEEQWRMPVPVQHK